MIQIGTPKGCAPLCCGKLESDPLFALCKLQSACDGAFDEKLLAHFYQAALALCARFVGWGTGVPVQVRERIVPNPYDGSLRLSQRPDSDVQITSGPQLVAMVNRAEVHGRIIEACEIDWCCYCALTASYTVGRDVCDPCCRGPEFDQGVMRVFAFLVEHRGDETSGSDAVISRSGAIDWLRPHMTTIM